MASDVDEIAGDDRAPGRTATPVPPAAPADTMPGVSQLDAPLMAQANDWLLRVEEVTKRFGNLLANDAVSLLIAPGEVYGLLGPNGAGKSTLVRQMIGLLKPTSGRIAIGAFDLVSDPDAARQLCSYLPQAQMPIDSFRVREAIELAGRIRGGEQQAVRARTNELLEALDIGEWADTIGKKLSGGVKRLVGYCMATVCPGRVVILDEPTNDVDPLRRRLLWEQVRQLGTHGCTVLLVTHNVLEAEKSVDRLAMMVHGRVVAEGTPASMKAPDRSQLRLQLALVPGMANPELPAWLEYVARVGNSFVTRLAEADAAAGIAWAASLIDRGIAEEYALGSTTLEDAYIRLIAETSTDGAHPEPHSHS
jgi:ABC-2 type transport system ATP-binding protein